METTMQAIGFRRYGAPSVLEQIDAPRPTITHDGVLIRVAAASVNPADWRIRSGQFKRFIRAPFPFIPGSDVAGVVMEVGPAVTRLRPGDAVYAMLPTALGGGYAEYAAVAEQNVTCIPGNISFAEAAAVPLTALTALQALRDEADLQPDQHVLINGASGGVGTFAIQIAKAMGAKVTAVASGGNETFVRSLGADEFHDYTQHNITTAQTGYDVVFDAANTFPWRKAGQVLRHGGTLVSVNPILVLPPLRLVAWLGRWRLRSLFVRPSATDLETLNTWIEHGQVRAIIEQCYPLASAAEAHRRSETQRVRGKLVLVVDEQLASSRASAPHSAEQRSS
jgi:NADPH:quinone reductase-like Zn-dependent oxidoreductase